MKIVVKFKQKVDALGVYTLHRIIDLTPHKKVFKNIIRDRIISNYSNSNVTYCKRVEEILSMDESEMLDWIMPDIEEHLSSPDYLFDKIGKYEMEIEIER